MVTSINKLLFYGHMVYLWLLSKLSLPKDLLLDVFFIDINVLNKRILVHYADAIPRYAPYEEQSTYNDTNLGSKLFTYLDWYVKDHPMVFSPSRNRVAEAAIVSNHLKSLTFISCPRLTKQGKTWKIHRLYNQYPFNMSTIRCIYDPTFKLTI